MQKLKLLHCADLHLGSALHTHLSRQQAQERGYELLHSFEDMLAYAVSQGVRAILISGDLFDEEVVDHSIRKMVLDLMARYAQLHFFYLEGNHDEGIHLAGAQGQPENLTCFSKENWQTISLLPLLFRKSGENSDAAQFDATQFDASRSTDLEHPSLSETVPEAAEQILSMDQGMYQGLNPNLDVDLDLVQISAAVSPIEPPKLDYSKINLLMLHGQIVETGNFMAGQDLIPIRALQGRNIDYLALGHIHQYSVGTIDARGSYCYPGCLEGRGFDEVGIHGFVLLTIDLERHTVAHEFVPFAKRRIFDLEVCISNCDTTIAVADAIEQALQESGAQEKDMVRVSLTGTRSLEQDVNIPYLLGKWDAFYYFFSLRDETELQIDYEQFAHDISLRGEFVRVIQADSTLSEQEKAQAIRMGFLALDEKDSGSFLSKLGL